MMSSESEIQAEPSRAQGTSRRRGREVALQVLYAIDLSVGRPRSRSPEPGTAPDPSPEPIAQPDVDPADPEAAFSAVAQHFEMPTAARAFAHDLVLGVCAHREKLDGLIGERSRHWRVDRMAAVDRNVLRLASFELMQTDTPVAVVLDEAVDLARRFGGDASPGFVNGILDAVARDVRKGDR